MNQRYLYVLVAGALTCLQPIKAERVNENVNDTIKTYNIGEVIVTSSTKETNDLRTLPGAVSILSPQAIATRQIDALKDISAFVPNLYMPDYGSKMTSAIYIRGIGARSSGQSIGLYVDNVPYLDKSAFDFELNDIQRIEVLRGPQGTLYGRNAMGGIVNIYALCPFDYQGTKGTMSVGNYGAAKAKVSQDSKIGENSGISPITGAVVGSLLGFLLFTVYPAQVFMGDVGSLALGGALGIIAVLLRQEFLLVIMGGVFVVETLSVILQVGSFKLRGQRIFRMAPIHHHYELKGWPEPRVIVRFWIISLMLVLIGLATLKVR